MDSCSWSVYGKDMNPLLTYLQDGRKNDRGWMRISEATLWGIEMIDKKGKRRIHLCDEENGVLVEVVCELDRLRVVMKEWPKKCNPRAHLTHAYGVSVLKLEKCVTTFQTSNFSAQQQKREDAGPIIFNSDAKRQQYFTAFHWY